MIELLFLLLPVAMAYGWFMGRNSIKQKDQTIKQDLSIKYSTGLNYLLSNQKDKAIDSLLEALKVEDDSVEAHFAMANLFRKRGELDRALKVHEHLVRHGNLPTKDKQQAVFELGKDFLSAGLYDRAEKMFTKLLKSKDYGLKSLTYLLQIFQSTKDWQQGIGHKKLVIKLNDKRLLHTLANFYCEQATCAFEQDNFIEVIELLEQALLLDPNSCRANWLMAKIYVMLLFHHCAPILLWSHRTLPCLMTRSVATLPTGSSMLPMTKLLLPRPPLRRMNLLLGWCLDTTPMSVGAA